MRSIRPGRRKALSSMSGLFVAATTRTEVESSTPSISLRIVDRTCEASQGSTQADHRLMRWRAKKINAWGHKETEQRDQDGEQGDEGFYKSIVKNKTHRIEQHSKEIMSKKAHTRCWTPAPPSSDSALLPIMASIWTRKEREDNDTKQTFNLSTWNID